MEPLKVDRTKLITPSEYAKMIGVTKAAVTKMMNKGELNCPYQGGTIDF